MKRDLSIERQLRSVWAVGLLLSMVQVACSNDAPARDGEDAVAMPAVRGPRRLADDPSVKPYVPKAAKALDFSGVDVGDAPMSGASPSLDALGKRIVAALVADDRDALTEASLTEAEYTQRFFPVLIHHRSALKMGPALAWSELAGESKGDLSTALDRYGGADLSFLRIDVDTVDPRPKVRLHQSPTIVVRTSDGEQKLSIVGSIVEHQPSGGFKILAFRDTP